MSKFPEHNLHKRFGNIPNENEHKRRMRIHQGWWRMNVLNEEPGQHPIVSNSNICNTILNGEQTKNNFLTQDSIEAVEKTLCNREKIYNGIIDQDRLFNNLLSSQPICFNFFGELMMDIDFGLKVLRIWWPDLTQLKRVIFEFAPEERYTCDNSAFDIAFEVSIGEQSGLIGLECKYTDTFSSIEYDKPAYKEIFDKSSSFSASYESLKSSKYNQLFRNQLIAESLIQNDEYNFVRTGLFCYEYDNTSIETGLELQKILNNPDSFEIITYRSFIERVQQLNLDWQKREWTMMLWARYCGTILSDPIYNQLKK